MGFCAMGLGGNSLLLENEFPVMRTQIPCYESREFALFWCCNPQKSVHLARTFALIIAIFPVNSLQNREIRQRPVSGD